MARKTKEEILKAKQEKNAEWLIANFRWLNDPKYFKTNYWSMAHRQSWAVQGKSGSCSCGAGYYSGSLNNKRRTTARGGQQEICRYVIEKLCFNCIHLIEEKIGIEFSRDYAP
jgi:hypothetical protein